MIHPDHPFATPAGDRDPLRRFRGRLASPVTLWTAGVGEQRGGLTVASTMVAEPDQVLGLVDLETDLVTAMQATNRFVVQLLGWPDRNLADQFAGELPAPGGVFAGRDWEDTEWGPVLAGHSWLGCAVTDRTEVGYRALIRATCESTSVADDAEPLLYHRGRYRRATGDR